jgi:hypothetical protein
MANNKVRFLIEGVLDNAEMSVSSQTSGLPAINVQDEIVRKVYRSTGKSNEYLQFKASGGPTGFNTVFIGNFSASRSSTISLQLNSTGNFGSGPAVNVTLAMATDGQGNTLRKITHFFDSVQRYQHLRLYWKDAGNASSNVEVGRIMVGRYIEPNRNLREGFGLTTYDPSRFAMTAGRQGYANVKRHYTEMTYSVSSLDEAEQDQILGIYAKVGRFAPLLVSLDPVSRPQHHTFYSQITTNLGRQQRFGKEMNLVELTFQEKN